MDTAHSIVEKIAPGHREAVSIALVKTMLKRGTLHPLRLLSDHHIVSLDGVQVTSFSQPAEGTTWKESKNGVKTFLRSCIARPNMEPTTDPKQPQGAEIWQRLETLRRRLEAACATFDELYAYVYTLKADHRRRAERVIADLTRRCDSDQNL